MRKQKNSIVRLGKLQLEGELFVERKKASGLMDDKMSRLFHEVGNRRGHVSCEICVEKFWRGFSW